MSSIILNAKKDFGAVGDDVADDTAAIQAALDAAYGLAPGHGGSSNPTTGYPANKSIFLPNGIYNVSSPLILNRVNGGTLIGAGQHATKIRSTATSGDAPGYGTVLRSNGWAYGLLKNMTLEVTAPQTSATFIGSITGNRLDILSGLVGTVQAGQTINTLLNVTPGTYITGGSGTVWTVNQSQNVSSQALATATFNNPFEIGGDGSSNLLENTFVNVMFEGGDYGCAIGTNGFQGSEFLWIGCYFVNCGSGMAGFNFNALDFTVLGGSFEGCGYGINPKSVSTFSYLSSVSFSGSTLADIIFDSFNGMSVEACSSTSPLFIDCRTANIKTKATTYAPAPTGEFCRIEGWCIMDGAIVTNAILQGNNGYGDGSIYIRGCSVPVNFISGSKAPGHIPENI